MHKDVKNNYLPSEDNKEKPAEKKQNKFKDILFILVLGSLSTLLLLGIKSYTYPKIVRYQEQRLKENILEAAAISYTLDNLDEVFERNIKRLKKGKFSYYLTPQNLYVFKFEGRGLWGIIEGLIILNPDLETIENIRIISQEETPGLGGRITEPAFQNQFVKKKVAPKLKLTLRRKAVKNNEIDAISGASMTSSALINMINEYVGKFRKIIRSDADK